MLLVLRAALVVLVLCTMYLETQAGIVYNEAIDGELSANNLAPTALGPLMVGANTVTGRVTAISAGNTSDIFSFQIPSGLRLDSIFLNSYSTPQRSQAMLLVLDDNAVFQYSEEEINNQIDLPDLSLVLGAVVVGNNHIGTDILARLADPMFNNNGIPFTRPLGGGTYSVYIQETGSFSNYSLQFNVSAVPEPSSLALLGVALFGVAMRRKRVQCSRSY